MNEKELTSKVRRAMLDWREANLSISNNTTVIFRFLNNQDWRKELDEYRRSVAIEWDRILNVLGVRIIENRPRKPCGKVNIRFKDPFFFDTDSKRHLEMSLDQATKILVLGLPSSKEPVP